MNKYNEMTSLKSKWYCCARTTFSKWLNQCPDIEHKPASKRLKISNLKTDCPAVSEIT
jgi:hypothetical protein